VDSGLWFGICLVSEYEAGHVRPFRSQRQRCFANFRANGRRQGSLTQWLAASARRSRLGGMRGRVYRYLADSAMWRASHCVGGATAAA
jgi:hypothetical protein